MQTTDTKARIAELRQSYTRLALTCRARGIRVSPATIEEYAQAIKALEAQLN